MKPSKPELKTKSGKRLRIRMLSELDLETTRVWRNHPETRSQFFFDQEISAQQHASWFEAYLNKPDDFVFILERIDDDIPIGQTSIYNVEPEQGRAEFGRFIIGDLSQRSQGLGKESLALTCALGFEQLGLKEIYLNVKAENLGAIKAYIALGFSESARDEQKVTMGIKDQDWREHAGPFLN